MENNEVKFIANDIKDIRDIQINDNVIFIDKDGLRPDILNFINSKEYHKVIKIHSIKTEPIYYIENCPYLMKNQQYPFMHTRVKKYVQ